MEGASRLFLRSLTLVQSVIWRAFGRVIVPLSAARVSKAPHMLTVPG